MKKILLAAAIVSIFNFQFSIGHAQQREHTNYLGLTLGGGLQGMTCAPAQGDHTVGLGFGAGLTYAHFFGKHFGLGFGVRYTSAASSTLYDFTETTADLVHPSNPDVRYNLNTTFDGWREHQRLGFVSLPVELLFRVPLADRWALLAGVGAAVDFNLCGSYRADEGTYATTGYFHSIGHSVQNLPQHGFSTYDADFEQDIDRLPVGVSLVADLGVHRALGQHWGLYLGLYGSYGISNLADENTEPLVNISAGDASQMTYNGTFASNQTDALRLLTVGAKVGIDFGWSCHRGSAQPQDEPVLVSEPVAPAQPKHDAEQEAARVAAEKAARERAAAEAERVRAEKQAAEKAAAEKQAAEKAAVRADVKRRLEGMTIAFDFAGDEPHFRTEDDLTLRALCAAMQADPGIKALVTGHTDNIGRDEANTLLGQQRADAVRQRMISLGAPGENITTDSRGEAEPIDTNSTEEGRARNRRAVITLTD